MQFSKLFTPNFYALRIRRAQRTLRRLSRVHLSLSFPLALVFGPPAVLAAWIAIEQLVGLSSTFSTFSTLVWPGYANPPVYLVTGLVIVWMVLVISFVVWITIMMSRLRAIHAKAIEHRALLCPRCLHDLRGSAESARCPECGQRFKALWLRKQWSQIVYWSNPRERKQMAAAIAPAKIVQMPTPR